MGAQNLNSTACSYFFLPCHRRWLLLFELEQRFVAGSAFSACT
jgi:hypothetical protein